MREYDLIPQKDDYWCVPACLQAILSYHNKKISQLEIAKNLTPSSGGFYMDDERITEFLSEKGLLYNYFNYNQTPFNEPDMVLKNMLEKGNHGVIGINNHVYLLLEFNDPDLILLDPKDKSKLKKNLLKLNREMSQSKFKGFFGLIKKIS